ncbi:hypothetical protein OAH87_04080 [Marinomonas sp.]|nr:hypothetical protein [Marinomonas sp.]MDB4837626.1 hypothetical protein [Marinomonas sp.]
MTPLIVIFIVLSLAGSIMWVLPSRKDRDQMALRLQARKLGLNVQLTSIDLPDKWDKTKETHKVAAYSYYHIKPLTSLSTSVWLLPYEVWKYESITEGWWSNRCLPLDQDELKALKNYSTLITAIKVAPEGVFLYWRESGDSESLNVLSAFIHKLAELKVVD